MNTLIQLIIFLCGEDTCTWRHHIFFCATKIDDVKAHQAKVHSSCHGFMACAGADWSGAQPTPQNSAHLAPFQSCPFPGLFCPWGGLLYTRIFPQRLMWNHVFHIDSIPSSNSKAIWMERDIKPNWRKVFFVLGLYNSQERIKMCEV